MKKLILIILVTLSLSACVSENSSEARKLRWAKIWGQVEDATE